jgi:hypothetical protein
MPILDLSLTEFLVYKNKSKKIFIIIHTAEKKPMKYNIELIEKSNDKTRLVKKIISN